MPYCECLDKEDDECIECADSGIDNMRETTFKILTQGGVEMAHCQGYMLVGNEDAVCFFIDPVDRASISASSYSDNDCPTVFLTDDTHDQFTEIEFTEFPGWRFHAGGDGKTIAVALVRREAHAK